MNYAHTTREATIRMCWMNRMVWLAWVSNTESSIQCVQESEVGATTIKWYAMSSTRSRTGSRVTISFIYAAPSLQLANLTLGGPCKQVKMESYEVHHRIAVHGLEELSPVLGIGRLTSDMKQNLMKDALVWNAQCPGIYANYL
jgi:hypothetical protein